MAKVNDEVVDDYKIISDISKAITKSMFAENNFLTSNHIDSYNSFVNSIEAIIKESQLIIQVAEFGRIYIGGIAGNEIWIEKKQINDNDFQHILFPNEARLRNMSYSCRVMCNIVFLYDEDLLIQMKEEKEKEKGKKKEKEKEKEKEKDKEKKNEKTELLFRSFHLFDLPIMLKSELCHLHQKSQNLSFHLGECLYDYGGYFIIEGCEKVIRPFQTTDCNNVLQILNRKTAKIRYNMNLVLTIAIKSSNQIMIHMDCLKKAIPYCIFMRALGIISDKKIIQFTLLDIDVNKEYLAFFRDSIHHARDILDQNQAILFIQNCLPDDISIADFFHKYFLSHVGTSNLISKAYCLGDMVFKLVQMHEQQSSFQTHPKQIRRLKYCGTELSELLASSYGHQCHFWNIKIARMLKQSQATFTLDLLRASKHQIFSNRAEIIVDQMYKYFHHNQRVEPLDRTSYFAYIKQLRSFFKQEEPQQQQPQPQQNSNTDFGFFCPLSLHSNELAVSTICTIDLNSDDIFQFLQSNCQIYRLEELPTQRLACETKLYVNGIWKGSVTNPYQVIRRCQLMKRIGIMNHSVTLCFNYKTNEIYVWTDAGRLLRPLYYSVDNTLNNKKISCIKEEYTLWQDVEEEDTGTEASPDFLKSVVDYFCKLNANATKKNEKDKKDKKDEKDENEEEKEVKEVKEEEKGKKLTCKNLIDCLFDSGLEWTSVVTGFFKKDNNWKRHAALNQDYGKHILAVAPNQYLNSMQGIVDYVDIDEQQTLLIAPNYNYFKNDKNGKKYTHIEIDSGFCLSFHFLFCPFFNQCNFTNLIKHAFDSSVSMYHSNWTKRMDNNTLLLLHGQHPLIKTYFNSIIPLPSFGLNVCAFIMNTNDNKGIVVNASSVNRGLFATHQFFETEIVETETSSFANVLGTANITDKRLWVDFSLLDNDGIIKQHTRVNENTALIGRMIKDDKNRLVEASVLLGDILKISDSQNHYVDQVAVIRITNNRKLIKLRIRVDHSLEIGDELISRNGFSGVVSAIVDEIDLPFSQTGQIPHIIIHPNLLTPGFMKELYYSVVSVTFAGQLHMNPFVEHTHQGEVEAGYCFQEKQSFCETITYDGRTGLQQECAIFNGIAHLQVCKKHKTFNNITSFSVDLLAKGMASTIASSEEHSIIQPTKGNAIEIPSSLRDDLVLLRTMNVETTFITENTLLKNRLYGYSDTLLSETDMDRMIRNLHSETKYRQRRDNVFKRDKKKITKIPLQKKIVIEEEKEEEETDNSIQKQSELDISSIYSPDIKVDSDNFFSLNHDDENSLQLLSMAEAMTLTNQTDEPLQNVLISDGVDLSGSGIISNSNLNARSISVNLEQERKPSSVLDVEVKEENDSDKKENDDAKRTIIM